MDLNDTISSMDYDEFVEEYMIDVFVDGEKAFSPVEKSWIPVVKKLRSIGDSVLERDEISGIALVNLLKTSNQEISQEIIEKVVIDFMEFVNY